MADPLSIAASVTGLLAVAGKISTIIYEFVSSVSDAPTSVHRALSTIESFRSILSSIEKLLNAGWPQISEDRKRMISVKELSLVFRESIISFSELEAIVNNAVRVDIGRFKWTQMKWVLREEEFSKCIQHVERHMRSLTSMLNILQWCVVFMGSPS